MPIEKTIALPEKQARFVEDFAAYGFHSHSSNELITKALDLFQENLAEYEALEASAQLYAEVYEAEEEMQQWTDSATQDWE